jgi:hypothetical protein
LQAKRQLKIRTLLGTGAVQILFQILRVPLGALLDDGGGSLFIDDASLYVLLTVNLPFFS